MKTEFQNATRILTSVLAPLEKRCRVPVVSSSPHAFMNAVRLVGLDPRRSNFGSVLAKA